MERKKFHLFLLGLMFLLAHVALYFVLCSKIPSMEELSTIEASCLGVGLSVVLWHICFRQIHIVCETGNTKLVQKILISQFLLWLVPALLYVVLLYALSDHGKFFTQLISFFMLLDFLLYEFAARIYIKVQCQSEQGRSECT